MRMYHASQSVGQPFFDYRGDVTASARDESPKKPKQPAYLGGRKVRQYVKCRQCKTPLQAAKSKSVGLCGHCRYWSQKH